MNKNLFLWRADDEVTIINSIHENVLKLTNIGEVLYILTNKHNLYYGEVQEQNDKKRICFKQSPLKCKDVSASSEYLFCIDLSGNLYKYTKDLVLVKEIEVVEETQTCYHGFAKRYKRKVKSFAINDFGGLLITEGEELWAFGIMPQISINNNIPKKVNFFEGRYVYNVGVGKDFAIAIVSRDNKLESELKESVLLVSECPHCVNNSNYASPNFVTNLQQSKNHINLNVGNSSDSSTSLHDNRSPEADSAINKYESANNERATTNMIFYNTEAAKEFLTRQFSRMSSAGEEYLNLETKTIKGNVSNMANLVYESVKSVGDKVAKFSKHITESSDSNKSAENYLETLESLPRFTSVDDLNFSHTSSEANSDHSVKDQYSAILNTGADIINREVWTWGNIYHGQLGIGDNIKRERPMIISKLTNIGAVKCSVHSCHAAVLTLDGRALLWGKNDQNQVSVESNSDQSSPKIFSMTTNERMLDVSCGLFHTALLSTHGNVYYLGLNRQGERAVTKLYCDIPSKNIDDLMMPFDIELISMNDKETISGKLFSTNNFVLFDKGYHTNNLQNIIVEEGSFLEELLLTYVNLIKPLQKKNVGSTNEEIYEKLVYIFSDLIYLTAANLNSLLSCHYGETFSTEVIIIKHYEEFLAVYKNYFGLLNNITSLDGYIFVSKLIDVPQALHKLRSVPFKKDKPSNEHIIKSLLSYPVQKLQSYKDTICELLYPEHEQFANLILLKWTQVLEEQKEKESHAEMTREFWISCGKQLEHLHAPDRRLVIDSHKHPIYLQGAGRFSSHRLVLLTDIFVHINGSSVQVYDLKTVWVETIHEETVQEYKIVLKMPEETFILITNEDEERSCWLHALQNTIKSVLKKESSFQTPIVRSAEYLFVKAGFLKDAKYHGRWSNAKMQGKGRLEWADGRIYSGQMNNNCLHGFGRIEIPDLGVYEGTWKENRQNGFGIFKYSNGDIYKGYFKDGLPHGHGCLKQGHFMSTTASVYIGEWSNGMKNGYGILDDIVTGEKYLGKWSDNKKHGNGIIVTSDGVYYEGIFNQDVLMGNGLMILEDGTYYEGDFKGIGHLNGKGRLTLNSGHTIDGHLMGSITEGIKINNGTLNILKAMQSGTGITPETFGKYCVPPHEKWIALFHHCYQMLGMTDTSRRPVDTQKIWHNVAVRLSNSYRNALKKEKNQWKTNSLNNLDTIPQFGMNKIDKSSFNEVKEYLTKAFESPHHPLSSLLNDLTAAYTTSYGGLKAHPLLLKFAVLELHSILKRIYEIILFMFPALPPYKKEIVLGNNNSEIASYQTLLHPIVLPRMYSPLFILYTLHNKTQDLQYWKRLTEWNKQPDYTLLAFLSVDKKFFDLESFSSPSAQDDIFLEAIETLQLLKTTFSPFEKVLVMRDTFQKMTQTVQSRLGTDYKWNMDDLFPVFMYIVVRARILQLGSEIHFIEDFIELNLEKGELGIMFTTLKACYHQILQEKASVN